MPTYDYQCKDCGHEFESFQSMKARPLRKCPECGEPKLQRLIGTGGGIIFKGSGFYETDYRSESYRKAAEKESKGASKDGDAKSDKKKSNTGTSDSSSSSASNACGGGCACAAKATP